MHLPQPLLNLFEELGIANVALATWLSRVTGLIIVWVAVWVLVRYLSRWLEELDDQVTRYDVSPREMKALDRLLDYIVITVGLVVSLAILGWTSLLYSALTAAGVFSVIIGFAVKDVAANFISGIFLLLDQPFAPGDYIEVGDHAGTVEDISLRTTTLVTLDGPVVHIPNSILAVKPTINYSVAETRRIYLTFSIAREADVDRAIQAIEGVLATQEGLLPERGQSVLADQVREYAVDIGVVCYAPSDIWLERASDVRQNILTALQQANIELAVPIRKNVNLDLAAKQQEKN